jgi:Peptidase M15
MASGPAPERENRSANPWKSQSREKNGVFHYMSKTSLTALFAVLVLAVSLNFVTRDSAQAAGSSCLPASLKSKLAEIRSKFGPIRIVSTHRPGARIAGSGKRSYHASCRAVDFNAPSGQYGKVVAWLKQNHSGGVGTYSCGMHHIHIDNGPRVRFHHCVNARGTPVGKKRQYAKRNTKKQYARNRSAGGYASNLRTKNQASGIASQNSQYAASSRRKTKKYAAF